MFQQGKSGEVSKGKKIIYIYRFKYIICKTYDIYIYICFIIQTYINILSTMQLYIIYTYIMCIVNVTTTKINLDSI